jgi:hypothetical protein
VKGGTPTLTQHGSNPGKMSVIREGAMFIRSKILNGNKYYQMIEGYRVGSRVRHRTIYSLGRYNTPEALIDSLESELKFIHEYLSSVREWLVSEDDDKMDKLLIAKALIEDYGMGDGLLIDRSFLLRKYRNFERKVPKIKKNLAKAREVAEIFRAEQSGLPK